MTQTHDLLRQILVRIETLKASGKPSLVVFDLDSTLFDVSTRTQQIMLDFSADSAHQERFPESIELLKNLKVASKDWGIKSALIRHGLHTHCNDFHEAVSQYWIDRFFSSRYLHFDHPIAGAPDYVWRIKHAGARLVYLTGRDQATMQEASQKVLAVHGFPPGELVLKPIKGSDDALFKVGWFDQQNLNRYGITVFFENEPVNLHEVQARHPEVEIVFVESTHSGKAPVSESWAKIVNFTLPLKNTTPVG
ncbi:MAG: HAD family hydrolase [Bdellovibrio sp.]|jgi:hypothetical protein